MTKIAFVRTRYLPPSETFIYEELKNIKKYKAIVFARKKMNLKRFPYSRIKRLPESAAKTVKLFRRHKIKLIHARFGKAGVRLIPVRRRLRRPMLTSFHGFDLPAKRKRKDAYHRKLSTLFKVGDKFTVPSQHMKQKLIRWGCPNHKIIVMYSGIDLNRFSYVERMPKTDQVTIIAVGRLHKKKGFPYLVKAFKKVHKKYPSTRLVIVGEGDERKKLKRLVTKLKLKRYVRFEGLVSHSKMTELLHRSDIFCLPSITTKDGNQEGIPNAIKEAMATGLPVVSTRHGGIPELVSHEVAGLLVAERSVKKLAQQLIYMITNPEERLEMGRRGRQRVEENFNSAVQVNRLEEIYKKLIGKRR